MKKLGFGITVACLLTSSGAWAGLADIQRLTTKDFYLKSANAGCQPKGMKADAEGRYLYVAEMCGKKDPKTGLRVPTASIYDLKSMSLSKTLITPVGAKKGILANTEVDFTEDGRWALIARAEGDKESQVFPGYGMLSVVDTDRQTIVKYIPVNGRGSKIISRRPVLQDRQEIVYVANYFSDDISIVDITGLKSDGNLNGTNHYKGLIRLHTNFASPQSKGYKIAPRGVAFTADGKYAIVMATETGSLIIVDAQKHQQIAELAPIDSKIFGRDVNVRHIVITKDGSTAYLSHMRGNAVSRIDVNKLIRKVVSLSSKGPKVTLASSFWNDILIPFKTAQGAQKILVLEDYPADHPNFANKKWDLAHPNTIVLDPIENRYLYVSHRTTSNKDYRIIDPRILGKVDVIDTKTGAVIKSLVAGAQPTALEISADGNTLISGGFKDSKLYFYNVGKLIRAYEK